MRRADTLIVGGGPAGAAAAIVLAQGGHAPLLLERRQEPTGTVCGGFLGWDALAALDRLGIDAGALGAVAIDRLRLVAGGRSVTARLPKRAAGLSRATLDRAMLDRAAALGAAVEPGVAVRRIDGARAILADGRQWASGPLIVATGKHPVRGVRRESAAAGSGAGSVGLRAVVPAPAGLRGSIELHLFRDGYAGVLMQEDGQANLCLSLSAERLREAGGAPAGLLAALAGEAPEIAALGAAAARWDAIAAVPYGWLADDAPSAAYRVGDQAAVIASLAGDGIAIALASGRAAACAILAGHGPAAYQQAFTRRAARPVGRAERIRHLAEDPAMAARGLALIGWAPWLAGLAARATRIGA